MFSDLPTESSHRDEAEDLPSSSPPDHEFISDSFQSDALDEDALKQEMQQLGMTDSQKKESEGKATGKLYTSTCCLQKIHLERWI